MSWFKIEARDGLVLRDGRPNTGRSESETVNFPYPSTIAGGVRTALGTVSGVAFERDAIGEVLKAKIRGPLLAFADGPGMFVRAPSDAVFGTDDSGTTRLSALRPIPGVEHTDLGDEPGRSLVGVPANEIVAGKPPKALPMYWTWLATTEWLSRPVAKRSGTDGNIFTEGGLAALPQDPRTHVSLDATGTAVDGELFGTSVLRLVAVDAANSNGKGFPKDLALLVDVDTSEVDARWQKLSNGTRPLGGKRKLVQWSERDPQPDATGVPPAVLDFVAQGPDKAQVRVLLLTPAHFLNGALPSWLLEPRHGVGVTLVAACVGRPETVSGWDFAQRRPKPSRRLVSAGSVYWLELRGTPAARQGWVEAFWMTNVSDGEQERRDGFGLAVLGVGP